MIMHGTALPPHDLASAWSWEPGVVIPLVVAAAFYVRGVRTEWKRAPQSRHRITKDLVLFAGGWALLVIALVSPMHRLGEVLFSAHMVQHEVLMTIAAPLLVLSRPVVPFLWAVPVGVRRVVGGAATRGWFAGVWAVLSLPSIATALHGAAIWAWHAPPLYNATLTNEWVHAGQHASFLGTALLFWWSLIHGRRRRDGYGLAVILVFLTAAHTTILGALLTLSDTPWYSSYTAALTSPWNLTPLEDQQLGGLIMWVPATIAYLVAALMLFLAWLRESELRVVSRENVARLASVVVFAVLLGCRGPDTARAAGVMVGGDAERGAKAIRRYGCASCHSIPGIRAAQAIVGPPLAGIAGRSYVAGVLSNTPEHMMQWLQNPQAVDNKTAMPNMGVTERDARDIATYLYTLK
jgi:cytochrome c oxidase assembly factor CtaG/cytochrome c2